MFNQQYTNEPEVSFWGKLKWYQKLIFIMMFPTLFVLFKNFTTRSSAREKIKRKMKYFNPTITEGFWGNKITWVGREKPLTDEQVEQML